MSVAYRIGSPSVALERIREGLESGSLNSIRAVLPDRAINDACKDVGYSFRERILTPIVTVLHMVTSAIWPEDSFQAAWDVLWDSFVSRQPDAAGKSPSSGSLSKARARLPLALWHRLFDWISNQAQSLSAEHDSWRGHRLVLVDGTCVSMADVPALREAFGTNRTHGKDGRFPLARLVAFSLANTMTVITYKLDRYRTSETSMALDLLGSLRRGDLLIADRFYAAAHFYARYASHGLEFLTRAHERLKVHRLEAVVRYNANDFVTDLPINPAYRRKDPSLPRTVRVRFIRAQVRVRGKKQNVWFATSLSDDMRYPAQEIIRLYGRRWRIETLIKEVKVNLSADVLRSQKPEGIRMEIAARLATINIVRSISLEAARQEGVDPLRISFTHTLRAIITFAPALATEPAWKLVSIYRAMLCEIGSHRVPERPGRLEPRMTRREKKHYPALRTTRREWRVRHAS